jgi:hypothetical protein
MEKIGLCGIPSLWVSKEQLAESKIWSELYLNELANID